MGWSLDAGSCRPRTLYGRILTHHAPGQQEERLARHSPPAVVFTAELEIAEHDGDLCAGDDQDDVHEAEEAEEVVELVQPHGGQDEEELDEDRAKGQDAANQHAEHL